MSPPEGLAVKEARPRAKIHQSSLTLAFWLRMPDDTDVLQVLPVVLPLAVTDTGKAEATYTVWEEAMAIEQFNDITEAASSSYSFFSMGRDSSNIKADREWDVVEKNEHHRDGCYSHCLFTVTGAVFGAAPGALSGLVSLDMSTRRGSHWELCKETLIDIVVASTTVVDGDPPVGGGARE